MTPERRPQRKRCLCGRYITRKAELCESCRLRERVRRAKLAVLVTPRCIYCGAVISAGRRACRDHADLPALDPHFAA